MVQKVSRFSAPQFSPQRQYEVSYLGLAIGLIFAIGGMLAWLAAKNIVLSKVRLLKKVGEKNSYFILAGGSSLTLLSIAALLHLKRKEQQTNEPHPTLQPE